MLKTNKRKSKSLVNARRWAAYAAAGAATAIASTEAADAGIVYSGIINESVRGHDGSFSSSGYFALKYFPLQTTGGSYVAVFRHREFFNAPFSSAFAGNAHFGAFGDAAGFQAAGYLYASNLDFGDCVSTQNFGLPASYFATMAWNSGYGNSEFLNPGVGYVGFKFDVGGGPQYGWARVDMDGAPVNGYTVIDWAYGMPGQKMTVGVVPEPGSLGMLAAGAVGLLAWRRARSNKKVAS